MLPTLIILVFVLNTHSVDFYVSQYGSDSNSGVDPIQPFQTLRQAQMAVRAKLQSMNSKSAEDVNVHLADGTWTLSSTWQMNGEDSGVFGRTVNWLADNVGGPTVSGGVNITGWQKVAGSNDMWVATLSPDVIKVAQSRQLFKDGQRLPRGVVPHSSDHQHPAALPKPLLKTSFGYTTTWTGIQNWTNPATVEFVYTQQGSLWTEPRCTVQSVKATAEYEGTTTYEIHLKQPCWDMCIHKPYGQVPHYPYKIENTGVEYLAVGGWYYDVATNKIYYKGDNTEEDPNNSLFVMPIIEVLLNATGTYESPVNHLTFNGINFQYATWRRPSEGNGYVPVQSGICVVNNQTSADDTSWKKSLSNVIFHTCNNIWINQCSFKNLGGFGLDLANGAQNNVVSGSYFYDVSGAAIQIGDMADPYEKNPKKQDLANTVVDCITLKTAQEYSGACSLSVGFTAYTNLTHNRVSHTAYGGISVGWGWARTNGNVMRNNIVNNNDVYHFKTTLRDGGGIYTLSEQPNSIMNENYVHYQVIDHSDKQGALYYDEGSANWDANNNVCGVDGTVVWLYIWTSSIHDIKLSGTYTNVTETVNHGTNITVIDTHQVKGTNWPAAAQQIIAKAGPRKGRNPWL